MRTVVIAGGTRGIGAALAGILRQRGDNVIALGSADADLTSPREVVALAGRLPDTIDALVLSAGRFSPRRVVTADGLEQTFAIYVVARYLLAEHLRPALEQGAHPVILNLTGTGTKAGRLHWDDLQLANRYRMVDAVMQGSRANDLLGAAFAARHPQTPIRYVLYNPLFVNSGLHRHFGQPLRALIGASAAVLGASTEAAAARLVPLLTAPPAAPLTALRKGRPMGTAFDGAEAERLYATLAELTAYV